MTVCSTDDRYDNDVHYMGGSVLGVRHARLGDDDLLAFTSRPPDLRYAGDEVARDVGATDSTR